MRRVARWLAVVGLVAVGAAVSFSDLAWAQPVEEGPPDPDAPPKNLKVLPKETPRREVTALMKTFNKALGVKCAYCHNTKDYALDEKKHKDIARSFMRMTLEMEKSTFSYQGAPKVRFNCYMCHRGQEEPVLTPP